MTQIRQRINNCAALHLPQLLLLLCQLSLLVLLCNGATTTTTTAAPPSSARNLQATHKPGSKCLLPMEAGPCRMSLERYYYDAQTNRCETFKFGGCRGNDNRFGFRKTCEDACLLTSTPPAATATAAAKAAPAPAVTKPAAPNSNAAFHPVIAHPTVRAVAATTELPKRIVISTST